MAAWCAQRAIRQYDGGTNAAGTPTTSGLAGGDTVSSLTQSFASKDVLGLNGSTPHVNGGYVVNDGNAGGNYTVTLNPAAGTITRAGLTVTAQTDNRGYNGTAGSNVAPVVAGTLYDRVGTAATQVYDTKHVGATHTLSASGLVVNDGNGGNNYAITYVNSPAAGVINAAPLTVTANSQAKAYGSTLTFAGSEITPTGLQNGETVGSATLASAGAVNTAHAAGYAITASAATGGTFTPSDYTITYVNGALTVNPAALCISADNAVRNVNQPNPPFTATYNGFKLGETPAVLTGVLAFTTPAVSSSPSGLYKIVPSGQSATDYAITYINGTLAVGHQVSAGSLNGLTGLSDSQFAALQSLGIGDPGQQLSDCTSRAGAAAGGAIKSVAASASPRCGSGGALLTEIPPPGR